ncbi:MAG: leucine-rich repeat domain-containing protein [Bacteroidales bacterium]|nr:leucine-rich repeat domain-containing protein [Bacteroidales bacterium]
MKKRFLSLALIAAVSTFQACDKESEDALVQSSDTNSSTVDNTTTTTPESNKVKMTFSAGHYTGTSKTAIMDGLSLGFSVGDKINVFDGTSANEFTGDITSGISATCNFTGTADPAATNFYAIYPSSATPGATSATAEIPASQTAIEGTFAPSAHIMVAQATDTDKDFKFKTVNSFLKITAPRNLTSVVLEGVDGENVAGQITVTGYTDFTVSGGDATSITLSGTMEKSKDYYISFVPQKYASGLKLTLTDANGNIATYTTKGFTAESNKVNKIAAAKLEALTYYTPVASADLSAYLASFTGEVAEVVLTDYDADAVKTALGLNDSKKVKLALPASVTELPKKAFQAVSNLVSIEMPDVTSIGDFAFQNCEIPELTSLPAKLTRIGNYAFYNCKSLALTSLPDNLTSIGNYAFWNCTSLELTSLPAKLTSIGNMAFLGCKSLALTSLPDELTSIGNNAFRGCESLALTSLPDKLTSIGDYAFYGCASLEKLTIPEKVETIGSMVFQNCLHLKEMTILGNPTIGDDAFRCSKGIWVTDATYDKYAASYPTMKKLSDK